MATKDPIEQFAFGAACVVAPLALAGSAAELYEIGCHAQLVIPLALPVSLDVPAVVAAAQIRAGRHRLLGWVVLLAGMLGSLAFQVAYVWHTHDPLIIGAHPVLISAALATFELAMPGEPVEQPPVETRARNRSARNVAGATPASTTVAPPPPAAGVPGSDGDRKAPSTGRQGRGRPTPAGPAPDNAASSLTAEDVVHRLQEAGEDCTKAAVMRVTGWGSGKALRLMPEITDRYQESNVRPIHKSSGGA